jgi:hypothetical protein
MEPCAATAASTQAVCSNYSRILAAGPIPSSTEIMRAPTWSWTNSGDLYGEIGPGNYFHIGAIGKLSRGSDGWTYTDLFNFNPTVGYAPPAPQIWDGKGNLYGTTEDGGLSQPACWTSSGCGLVFKMTPNGDSTRTYHILHRFACFPNDGEARTVVSLG